jgi:hypothetical protein
MTDLTPYVRIVQRAERLATSEDADATDALYAAMLAELTALGPPDDPRARAALWGRFDAARRAFRVSRISAEPLRPVTARRGSLFADAFAGYVRLFSFRVPDSRARFWPFALIGVPAGAAFVAAAGRWVATGPLLALFLFPLLFLAFCILFALATAVRRRLLDAGVDPWLFLALLYVPFALGLNLGMVPVIYSPTSEIRHSEGMTVAALIVTALIVGNGVANLALACAQPTGSVRAWGRGPGVLILSMFVPVLLPLLLFVAVLFAALSSLGIRPRTTRVAASRRRVAGRWTAAGRWQRGSTRKVRAHSRRLEGHVQTAFSELVGRAGGSVAIFALLVAACPVLIWRLEREPPHP